MRVAMHRALSNVTGVSERAGVLYTSAAVTLDIHQRHIRASTTGAAFTITLAAPEDMLGEWVYIFMVTRSATDDITIAAGNEGSNIVLNLAGENVLLYSTGVEWIAPYANGPTVSG